MYYIGDPEIVLLTVYVAVVVQFLTQCLVLVPVDQRVIETSLPATFVDLPALDRPTCCHLPL